MTLDSCGGGNNSFRQLMFPQSALGEAEQDRGGGGNNNPPPPKQPQQPPPLMIAMHPSVENILDIFHMGVSGGAQFTLVHVWYMFFANILGSIASGFIGANAKTSGMGLLIMASLATLAYAFGTRMFNLSTEQTGSHSDHHHVD